MNKYSGQDWAMPSARATHASHRAVLRRLGLSVGIAIALAGCANRRAAMDEEVPPHVYYSIAESLEFEKTGSIRRRMVRLLIADGKITYADLDRLNRQDEQLRDAAVRGVIADIKRDLGQ